MKVCVLQPDYSTSEVDYQYYDPPRNLCQLLPEATVDHVFLNKLTVYRQLRELSRKGYDVFVNLCEGYLEWTIPSLDVIHYLELLNLPYTGPDPRLYDPPKELMKYVAYTEQVRTPTFKMVRCPEELKEAVRDIGFPLFVKPAKAGDSLGVDEESLVRDEESLERKVLALLPEYGQVLVEQYIDGREFTVLLAASPVPGAAPTVFKPVEYIFPKGRRFKTYALKTSELHPNCNVPCPDHGVEARLREAAARIFKAFGGLGYGRLDFRLDGSGELYFLEINFTCSVFYSDGYEGSADYILRFDGTGPAAFLHQIIAEGIARYKARQKPYLVKGSPISGYGIYAKADIRAGDIIFKGEGSPQRIITRQFVERHWPVDAREVFSQYAVPLSGEVFTLWGLDPADWAPQNHSCRPNTAYRGLDVVALKDIARGEELTLDYATIMDTTLPPFTCHCGMPECRGVVRGTKGNSVSGREGGM